jgi:hypothetical protein
LVGSALEVLLAGPFDLLSPGFTASPVAYEVLVTGVNEHLKSALEDASHLGGQVGDPVSQEEDVHWGCAFHPSS